MPTIAIDQPARRTNYDDLSVVYRDRPELWHGLRLRMTRAGLNGYSLLRYTRDTAIKREVAHDENGRRLTIYENMARKGLETSPQKLHRVMRERRRSQMRAALIIACLCLAAPALAQPTATAGQSFAWDYPDADVQMFTVTHFEVSVDMGPSVDVGMTPYTAPESYVTPIPAVTPGSHTVSVAACNAGGCSASTPMLDFVMRVFGSPTNLRIVDTPGD